jgi:hypothetical protein
MMNPFLVVIRHGNCGVAAMRSHPFWPAFEEALSSGIEPTRDSQKDAGADCQFIQRSLECQGECPAIARKYQRAAPPGQAEPAAARSAEKHRCPWKLVKAA